MCFGEISEGPLVFGLSGAGAWLELRGVLVTWNPPLVCALVVGRPVPGESHLARASLNGTPVVQVSLDLLQPEAHRVLVPGQDYPAVPHVGDVLNEAARWAATLPRGDRLRAQVIVQDVLQPLTSRGVVRQVRKALSENADAVALGLPVKGLLLKESGLLNRRGALELFTPYGFRASSLVKLADLTASTELLERVSDEMVLYARFFGRTPATIPGDGVVTRIPSLETLAVAEAVIKTTYQGIPACSSLPSLAGKRVLVLGGSGGIGSACLRHLETLGATPVAPPRISLDLTDKAFYVDLAAIDGVIHAAGAYAVKTEEIIGVNFLSCVRLLQIAELQAWQGPIVFLSSTASTYGRESLPVYSASKAALNTLIEAEHRRLAQRGILVMAVAPAKVNTRMQEIVNPTCSPESMLTAQEVAGCVIQVLCEGRAGQIVFLRNTPV